ncbi:hypothetical protein MSG28_014904 [Choristoneura fumiferana]|uniref:Uncharacterized protein n=1 Tax=Choristoneura fumiferana TaxID=7141 RepID=A0ACC0KY57_CHOFU|nr:hypothetical protein MSG28_014904 [Choristoneura fumiferana]
MIVYFLLIILVKVVNSDDNSDTKYIETLPASVKKGLLDKVARRILNEVPEVNSRDTDINGDILADKLEEQSGFVKRILKQEIESLKARRRYYQKHKKFRKSGNDNDKLSGILGSENFERNDTQVSELHAKALVSDKIDVDSGHIDLTMRSARSKRGDSFLNVNESTLKNGLPDEHGSYGGGFVPVTIDIDGENDEKEPIKGSNGNTTELFKVQKSSEEDIQIKSSKQGEERKSDNNNTEIPDITSEKADSVTETSTKNHPNSETTLNIENSSVNMYFGRRSEDLDLNKTEKNINTATVDVSKISDSPNTNSNDSQTLDDYTTTKTSKIFDTTVADVKDSYLETDEDTINKTDHVPKYSSESYLENPIIDSKGRKSLELLNSDETSTQTIEETPVKSISEIKNTNALVTEEPHSHYSEITTLIMATTETPSAATAVKTEASVKPSTNIATKIRIDLQKDLEAANEHNKEETKLTVTEILTATQANKGSNKVSKSSKQMDANKSSKQMDANYTKINVKKPCNETNIEVGVITDCDKKRNKTDNSTPETPSVTDKIDKEPKVKATIDAAIAETVDSLQNDTKKPCNETSSKGTITDCDKKKNQTDSTTTEIPNVTEANIEKPTVNAMVDAKETESKNILRTSNQKPLYDSLIHFGDMQIKKEYEVFEVVYSYDPQNAYFNAFNRLGPNEDDEDEDSETSDPGNESVIRSNTLRMSRIEKKHKKKLHKTTEDDDSTTKAYYSTEEIFEENECKDSKEDVDSTKEVVFGAMSDEIGHINNPYIKTHLNHVRLTNYQNKIFGYVPTHQERKRKFAKEVRYLYNNVLGKSTEEVLDETKDDEKKNKGKKSFLRINGDGRYDERLDVSEDKTEHTRKDAKDDKKIEVVVVDMNKSGTSILRQGGYFSSKYKWDEEGNSFRNEGKVYNLDHIVPYSTEKSIILEQRKESNKIFDRIKTFGKPIDDNNSAEIVSQAKPEDVKKAIEYLKNLDMNKTLFNKSSINDMVKGVESNARPPILPPRHFSQYLKQRLAQSRHQSEMQNTHSILRSEPCHTPPNCEFQLYGLIRTNTEPTEKPAKYKAPNEVLNSIDKITQITPEVDMLQNIQSMLQINGFPIARSREDDVELYVRILKDMVKLDNKALEDYDWLGTTVAIQSALAKLKEIIDHKKNGQRIHPSDLQLFKYVEALYTKASEVTKDKEGETLDEHVRYLKRDRKANDERMALPKTHKKIKNPLKILKQISDLVNKKVLRDKIDSKTKNIEAFLDCMQQCLDDVSKAFAGNRWMQFHTAIKELTRITKYNQQRWYKNIKELYLSAGGQKEYLEVLLHLYSMKLFSLIEESAENGVEVNYRMYMKENRLEVDRAQAEMVFVIRILKAIHDLRAN